MPMDQHLARRIQLLAESAAEHRAQPGGVNRAAWVDHYRDWVTSIVEDAERYVRDEAMVAELQRLISTQPR